MEQSVGTSLETGNKNNKQKTDYQEDRVSYTRSSQPREGVNVLSDDSVQQVMYNTQMPEVR